LKQDILDAFDMSIIIRGRVGEYGMERDFGM
jgi:hypothetical protein